MRSQKLQTRAGQKLERSGGECCPSEGSDDSYRTSTAGNGDVDKVNCPDAGEGRATADGRPKRGALPGLRLRPRCRRLSCLSFRQRPVPFAPNISERQPTVVFSDQAKADQVRHVARQQMLRLRNTKGDAAQGDFLMRTEWCFKTTFHGLPPSSCSVESLGANRPRVTALSAFGLLACRASPL
jgi:hypothetical protein